MTETDTDIERRGGLARAWRSALTLVALAVGLAAPVEAKQAPPADSSHSEEPKYKDPGARDLHRAAMAYHGAHVDRLAAYEATIQQRIGVRLRMPLKDRMLYRAETAHRVTWGRSGPVVIQALGVRE
ncbi:MAG: hypothetical protein WEA34_10145, partial [Gemmatimonadota bacterium]